MLIPMVLPLAYAVKYKRDSLIEIGVITFTMILIVIAYWPFTLGFNSTSNIVTKFILFVLLPLILLNITWKIQNKSKKKKQESSFEQFGIKEEGFEKSLYLGLLFLPLMLVVTFTSKYMIGGILEVNFP